MLAVAVPTVAEATAPDDIAAEVLIAPAVTAAAEPAAIIGMDAAAAIGAAAINPMKDWYREHNYNILKKLDLRENLSFETKGMLSPFYYRDIMNARMRYPGGIVNPCCKYKENWLYFSIFVAEK